ncbi:MAG: hypothetical protein DYG91_10130, partial [Chloroflexi bacterium CFX7]|nr:hypothetical protein [Chloroflexi bacterium CFX7]
RAERLEAMAHAARACRRLERLDQAERWWLAMIAEPRSRLLAPYVELAMLAEHQHRDRARALAYVDEALALVRRGLARPGSPNSQTSVAALEKRRQRLIRGVSSG